MVGIGLVLAVSVGVTVVAATEPDPDEALALPGTDGGKCQNPVDGEPVSPSELTDLLLDLSADDYELYGEESGPLDLEGAAATATNTAAARAVLRSRGFRGGEMNVWVAADGLVLVNAVLAFPSGEDACRYVDTLARITSEGGVDRFPLEGVPDSLAITVNQTEKTALEDPYYVKQALLAKARHVYVVALVRSGAGPRPTSDELAELAREQLARG